MPGDFDLKSKIQVFWGAGGQKIARFFETNSDIGSLASIRLHFRNLLSFIYCKKMEVVEAVEASNQIATDRVADQIVSWG